MSGDLIRWYEEESSEIEATGPRGGGSVSGCGDLISRYEDEAAAIEAASGTPDPETRQIGSCFDIGALARKVDARRDLVSKCESPIEVTLGCCIIGDIGPLLDKHKLELQPQFWWTRFRIDFAILSAGDPVLFIECDGKEFHSSPEQRDKDRRKDQAAERACITLLRFSGSEIHRYPDGCVHRVLEHLVRAGAV